MGKRRRLDRTTDKAKGGRFAMKKMAHSATNSQTEDG